MNTNLALLLLLAPFLDFLFNIFFGKVLEKPLLEFLGLMVAVSFGVTLYFFWTNKCQDTNSNSVI
jgi:NADH-quinone oxidoreductase subunit L